MIKYHERYAGIKGLPGYFWNLDEDCVYSIKVQGVLKKIKEYTANLYVQHNCGILYGEKYYSFSKNGKSTVRSVRWIRENLVYEDTIC